LQQVGRGNGKKNSGLSRRKGQAWHETLCDNRTKALWIRGLFFPGFFVERLTFVFHDTDIF
jgi:hypothetical protein